MPFVDDILKCRSVAFVGIDKNSGKTEAMNYFLQRASLSNKTLAVTSIGIDGEQKDQVTQTEKPEITLCNGTYFLTCEAFYKMRKLHSEIYDVSHESTALGRLVTAKVLDSGKIMLAGPADTISLKKHISRLQGYDVDTVVVDGALSRVTIASPTITESLVFSTGAVVSNRIDDIVSKSAFQIDLIRISEVVSEFSYQMNMAGRGIYNHTDEGLIYTDIDSIFTLKNQKDKLFDAGKRLFFSGVVNDTLLEFLSLQPFVSEIEVVVRDFTKLFLSKRIYDMFLRKGGKISVVNSSKLMAVCVNPISPLGYKVSSEKLCAELSQAIGQSVYDVKTISKL